MSPPPRLRVAPTELGDMPLFSTAQAEQRGISRKDLTAMVRRDLLWRPARGWYSSRVGALEHERHMLRALAVLRMLGHQSVACRHTAVLLHGLPLARTALGLVEVSRTTGAHGRVTKGVRISEMPPGATSREVTDPVLGEPVLVVDPATAIVGTAMTNNPNGALVAGDAALRDRRCTRAQITAALERGRRATGIDTARQILQHLEPRHESPGETLTAAILRRGPWDFDPQVWVRARGHDYRLDFALREYKIAIEFDGEIKYTGPEVMAKQLARDADLEAEGWVVLHFGWADLEDDAIIMARVGDAVAAAHAA